MRWIAVVLACGIAGAAGWALHADTPHRDAGRSIEPSTASTAPSPLVFAGGVVEGASPEIVVRPEVSGRIREVRVEEGDRVTAGDVLAVLDSELAELTLREARAALSIAQAQRRRLGSARSSAKKEKKEKAELSNVKFAAVPRHEPLVQGGLRPVGEKASGSRDGGARAVTSPTDETTESVPSASLTGEIYPPPHSVEPEDLEIADARVAQAEAAVRRQTIVVEKHTLLSPMDGIVARMDARPGELVDPAEPRERWIIVDPSLVRVRAYVEELDAMKVSPGMTALVAAVGRPHQQEVGRVVACAPTLRPKTHRNLKPGERIDVRVREIVVELNGATELLIGLPVEVFLQPRKKP